MFYLHARRPLRFRSTQPLRSKYAIIIFIYGNHPSPSTDTCRPKKHIERALLSSDYSQLLSKNVLEIIRHRIDMNEKICSHFVAEKNIFRIIIQCNNIFETNIISRGYLIKLKNYGNSRGPEGGMISTPLNGNSCGVGVLKQNIRPLGVGAYGYFLKLHIDRSLSTKNIN